MKILLITEQFPPLIGGAAVYLYNLSKRLTEEVLVYTNRHKGAALFDRREKVKIIRGWIWHTPLSLLHPTSLIGPFYLFFSLLKCIKQEKIELIYCGSVFPFAVYGLVFKWLFGLPYLVFTFGEEIIHYQRNSVKKKVIAYLLRNVDKLVCISEFTQKELLKLGLKEKEIVVIPGGIDWEIFRPKDCSGLKESLRLEGKRIILTLARLTERKGQDVVIKALPKILEKVPNAVYLIVGGGASENRLRDLAKSLKLEDKVIFVGAVPPETCVDYYNICDLLVMPNRRVENSGEIEGFGLVFLEANACGKPVIGGRTGGAQDAILDGQTGILLSDPTNPDEVSQAILKLLLDEQLAKRFAESGRNRARALFNWDSLVQKLIRVNQIILNRDTAASAQLKILYVIENLYFGGGERVFAQLITALDKQRYQVFVACTAAGKFVETIKDSGQIIPFTLRQGFSLTKINALAKIMKEKHIQIVHSQGGRADFFARLAAAIAKVPLVVSTVTIPVEQYNVNLFKKTGYVLLERFSRRFVSCFTVVSEALRENLWQNYRLPAEKISKIYNGVELPTLKPNQQEIYRIKEALNIGQEVPVVGFVGRLAWEKGLTYFIQAIKLLATNQKLEATKYLIVGEGKLRKSLKQQVEKSGLKEKVIFTGFRQNSHQILAALDILVLPSLLEGQPMVLLEAMALAKPIVATNISGVNEPIADGESGILIPAKNPQALAEAINYLLTEQETASRLGCAARTVVEQKFDLKDKLKQYQALYESGINGKLLPN